MYTEYQTTYLAEYLYFRDNRLPVNFLYDLTENIHLMASNSSTVGKTAELMSKIIPMVDIDIANVFADPEERDYYDMESALEGCKKIREREPNLERDHPDFLWFLDSAEEKINQQINEYRKEHTNTPVCNNEDKDIDDDIDP